MTAPTRRIELYDTTLRDGMQGAGINLSLQDKLLIAARLDEVGLDYIEGGYPLSNPKDEAFFVEMAQHPPTRAKLAAFGMTRRKATAAADDAGMKALLSAGTPVVTLVGKAWDLHVREVLGVSAEENLAMIAESVRLCREAGRTVLFDAEHVFDGLRRAPDYAMEALAAAAEAGAARLVLCDTNGGSLPEQIAEAVAAVRRRFDAPLGIHCHNDAGLAVANSLAAVAAGVDHVQGTINGIGERCGNVDLTTVAANLALKLGCDVLADGGVAALTELSRYVYEMANQLPCDNQPYVGSAAFAHKGGMHVHAVRKTAASYEHVDPAQVGNARHILLSELAGASNVAEKLGAKLGIDSDRPVQRRLLAKLQDLENEGYMFEAAEASFELLARRELGRYHPFWQLEHYRAEILNIGGRVQTTEAIVKLRVNGEVMLEVAEGDGPVDALSGAFVAAVAVRYPGVRALKLIDYKVRVINPTAATAAKVRVTITFRDEQTHELFGTVGVSENIIDASWLALSDAYEYKLLGDEDRARGD